jgi:DNA-binding GntR family transcriptional regulator
MTQNQTLRPQTIVDYVLTAIRGGILTGRYSPGSKLDQQTLADELGVSIIPVRESLRQLEVEGFVRIHSRRGAFVAELSVAELKEIYLIRETLEELATLLAVPLLTPAGLEQLNTILEEMAEATRQQDFAKLLDLNRLFHFTIYEASQRPLLLQMVTTLWDRSSLYRRWYTYLPERAEQALIEHRHILAACQRGEARAAGEAIRYNIRQTTAGILARIGQDNG